MGPLYLSQSYPTNVFVSVFTFNSVPWMKSIMFVSFFVWGLISNSRMFNSHGDISITGDLYSELLAIEQ